MVNTQPEYWDVDGESLATYAYNIRTKGRERMAPPPVRGDDEEIPFAPGENYLPREVGSRIITLEMWVTGANADGTIPSGGEQLLVFMSNWRKLVQTFYDPYNQKTVTKRFYDDAGVLQTVTGKIAYAGGLNPALFAPTGATFTVDLKMPDPFFYGAQTTINFSAVNNSQTFVVPGQLRTLEIEIDFLGALNTPRLTNTTNGVWCQYTSAMATGDKVTIKNRAFTAEYDPSVGSNYMVSGRIDNNGAVSPFFMRLERGSNTLQLTATGGTGTAVLRYKPVWF